MRIARIKVVPVFLGIVLAPAASAQYSVSLTVPLTAQKNDHYCGPASAQMTMMSYPTASSRKCFQQDYIYSIIQKMKQDMDFYSDPDGVKDAIRSLNPPAGEDDFRISSGTDRTAVMHDILYSMSARKYPSVVLVNGGDHWVVVTGFKTDVDPRTGSSVLQELEINDPWPPAASKHDPCTSGESGGGVVRIVTGSSWYGNDWATPNRWGAKWLNKYVAVIGSAQAQGTVIAREEVNKVEVISALEAVNLAQNT
jgi:hypothetical protein